MITLKLDTNNANEWEMYDTIVMRQIPHAEEWEGTDENNLVVIVTLSEEDYKFWFVEEEEEEA